MRYTGPRNKVARREGVDLGLKTPGSKSHSQLLRRLNIPPGQHGPKGKRKFSERRLQLREKQKLRFMFGITERQLKKYFFTASKKKGNTAIFLARFLEQRLDNIVYRLGFAPTRPSARQLVVHGHIHVNNKKVTVPSYEVELSDTIYIASEKILQIPYIEKSVNNKDVIIPNWLERKDNIGRLIALPGSEEIEKQVNLRLVIEYYSR